MVAMNYFEQGCNCSQAVVRTFTDELGIDEKTAMGMAVAFGGGMSKEGKTCGCLSGALMVLGLRYGMDSVEDVKNRLNSYEEGKQFMKCFHEEFGATECRELIRLDLNNSEDMEIAKQHVFGNRCKMLVGKTVALLETQLSGNMD